MKINRIFYRSRNDFKAVFECERCGFKFAEWGYSDSNYYDNVIPNAICPKCGLNSKNENEKQLNNRLGRVYRISYDTLEELEKQKEYQWN